MGSCVSLKKASFERQSTILSQNHRLGTPELVIEENFKILDYTRVLKNITEISQIKNYFLNYKPNDIRCVKRKLESNKDHSHLMITFNNVLHGEVIGEVGLITDYSLYGFSISIGEITELRKISNLNSFELELLYLPKADNQHKVSLGDVIEWAYEHKDEQYMSPYKIPELNMGKRIFTFITDALSDKHSSSRI